MFLFMSYRCVGLSMRAKRPRGLAANSSNLPDSATVPLGPSTITFTHHKTPYPYSSQPHSESIRYYDFQRSCVKGIITTTSKQPFTHLIYPVQSMDLMRHHQDSLLPSGDEIPQRRLHTHLEEINKNTTVAITITITSTTNPKH